MGVGFPSLVILRYTTRIFWSWISSHIHSTASIRRRGQAGPWRNDARLQK